jgi:TPR repeat protein
MAFQAQMIIDGIAPTNDINLAFSLFEESASHNDSRGLNGLGYMYLNGFGVQKDVKKALKYFLSMEFYYENFRIS